MGVILSSLKYFQSSILSLLRQRRTADCAPSSENHAPFEIAIIGAGIGGLSFAIGCLKNNVRFALYEAASQYSIVGAGVGLGPNALRAMDLIDPRLKSRYYDISSGNLTPNKDHIMMDALYAEDGFGDNRGWVMKGFGAGCYDRTSAHRRDLLDILTSMIPRENVRFSKRVKSMQQGEDKVIITFEDGEVVTAAAVVGSDGIKGPTRKYVLGDRYPEEVSPTYSGKYVYRSIIPMKDALEIIGEHAGDSKTFLGHDVNFITFPISRGTQCNLVAFKYSDKPWTHHQLTKRVTKEEMVADFSEGVDKRLVKLLDVSLSPDTESRPQSSTNPVQIIVGRPTSVVSPPPHEHSNLLQQPYLSPRRLSSCNNTPPSLGRRPMHRGRSRLVTRTGQGCRP